MRIRTISKVLVLAMALSGIVALSMAQTAQKPKFDVTSIKRSTVLRVPAEILQQIPFSISAGLKGGRLVAQGVTIRGLMRAAYAPVSADANPLLEGQIVGGPTWIGTDLFDIEAKAESSAIGPKEAQLMLQSLLEDRFQLRYHRAERELPVLSLVVAKGGHKLRLSDDQTPAVIDPATFPKPSFGGAKATIGDVLISVQRPRGIFGSTTKYTGDKTRAIIWSGAGVPLSRLVFILENQLHRPVMNKTDLKGLFDIAFTVEISTDFSDPGVTNQLPQYASALEKQLGLKLESVKAPMEVLVIESVQHPSEN